MAVLGDVEKQLDAMRFSRHRFAPADAILSPRLHPPSRSQSPLRHSGEAEERQPHDVSREAPLQRAAGLQRRHYELALEGPASCGVASHAHVRRSPSPARELERTQQMRSEDLEHRHPAGAPARIASVHRPKVVCWARLIGCGN